MGVTAIDLGWLIANFRQLEIDTKTKRLVASNLELNSISSRMNLWQSKLPADSIASLKFYAALMLLK
jgi:hypothetical protein